MALFMSLDPDTEFLDLMGYCGRGAHDDIKSGNARVSADQIIDEFEAYLKVKNSYLRNVDIKGRDDLVSMAALALDREYKSHPGEPGVAAGMVIVFAMTYDRLRESV